MTEQRSMQELAARWSELLMAEDGSQRGQVPDAVTRNRSVLRPGATEEEIRVAEERLGRRLPPSYREFLLASNGAYADTEGVVAINPDRPSAPGPDGIGFLPVQDIGWLRDRDPEAASQLAVPEDEDEEEDYRPVEEDRWTSLSISPLADGLWITPDPSYEGLVVLIPIEGAEEWQLWDFYEADAACYRSFRSFLEDAVARREPCSGTDEVRELIARARGGDDQAQWRLVAVTGEEAVPMLADLLDDPELGVLAGRGLANIGSASAIEALVLADPDVAGAGLASAARYSERARDVLADRGVYLPLFEVQDPRAFAIAARHIEEALVTGKLGNIVVTVNVLGQSGDDRYIPLLQSLLGRDKNIQLNVAHALACLGSLDGEQALEDLAQDPDSHARGAAAGLLKTVREERLACNLEAGAGEPG